jgi:hypothetical protein
VLDQAPALEPLPARVRLAALASLSIWDLGGSLRAPHRLLLMGGISTSRFGRIRLASHKLLGGSGRESMRRHP